MNELDLQAIRARADAGWHAWPTRLEARLDVVALLDEVQRLREQLPWGTATPPSWQQIAEAAVRQRDTLRARVQHIHRRNEYHPHYCVTCRAPHPCSTIRALAEVTDG